MDFYLKNLLKVGVLDLLGVFRYLFSSERRCFRVSGGSPRLLPRSQARCLDVLRARFAPVDVVLCGGALDVCGKRRWRAALGVFHGLRPSGLRPNARGLSETRELRRPRKALSLQFFGCCGLYSYHSYYLLLSFP